MSDRVRQILATFDALSDDDRLAAGAEILRRLPAPGDIPDAGFEELAGDLFAALDAEEAARADG